MTKDQRILINSLAKDLKLDRKKVQSFFIEIGMSAIAASNGKTDMIAEKLNNLYKESPNVQHMSSRLSKYAEMGQEPSKN